MYGTLSHSHLLLTCLSIQTGAKWDVPTTEKWACLLDQNDALNYAAAAALDEGMATLCRDGLEMEVLSWKMCVEEPRAVAIISQSLNKGQTVALGTSELTALAVLTGEVTLQLETAVAGRVSFEAVKAKVRGQLDMYVDEPEFIALFEFVVNQGAGKNPFIEDLLSFTSKFVEQKTRHLRLNAFAVANTLPLETPRSKNAVIMRACSKTPSMTWCPSPEASWARSDRTEREGENV